MFDRLFGTHGNSLPSVSPREAAERLAESKSHALLLDVREAWEFARGHARGAKNIPLSQLHLRAGEVGRNVPVYVICQSGNRSQRATRFLLQQGIEQVYNVNGGTTVWQMHGLPMNVPHR